MGGDSNDLTFFLDENISRSIAQAMTALGHRFEHLLDHFPQGTPDVEFLPKIAEKGWLLVTQDKRIRRKPHERKALMNTGVGAFIFTGRAQKSTDEFTIDLLSRLTAMKELSDTPRPFVFGIPNRGKIRELDAPAGVKKKKKRKRTKR